MGKNNDGQQKKMGCLPKVLIGLVVIGVIGAIGGGGGNDKETKKAEAPATTAVATTQQTTEAATEAKATESKAEATTKAKKKNKKAEATTEEKIDWSVYHDDDDHMAAYVTITQEAVDKYISGAKWPWGFDSYVFLDYDDKKEGCIVGTVESLEIKDVPLKQNVMVIFTIAEDGEHYTVNSVAVGDNIFQDDGKLQSLLDKFNGVE